MKHRTEKRTLPTHPSASRRRQRILVPFDFSEGARLALRYAIVHARQFKSRLTLLHIVHLPYLGIGFGPGEGFGMEDDLIADTSKHLSALARGVKQQGVPADAVVRIGNPGADVVDAARREDIDLVIMGTRGRTGLKHALLGSVAEAVVRNAPCPVLVVRDRTRKTA